MNHLARERGGVEAGGKENQEEGREGPSLLSNSPTPSKSGSSSFAVRKASFAETDAMPQLSPDVLCISAAFEHVGGSRLESQALMFTVGPKPFWLCREGHLCRCLGCRGMLGLGSILGMGSPWRLH